MTIAKLSRRHLLQLMGATALVPLAQVPAFAQNSGVRALVLSDLHSAYERLPQLLSAVASQVGNGANLIVINGDVFELGNVVAMRSGGSVDWAFLERLVSLAPVVINIGNHEPDFDNDLANFVAQAEELGIFVVSTIVDSRTGEAYAPAEVMVSVGDSQVQVVGIATDAINTYPKPTREMMTIPAPAAWAAENLPEMLAHDDIKIVLSHAGVVADRDILPLLPVGTLLVGGHDHLRLGHEDAGVAYVHTGSWSSVMTIVDLVAGAAPKVVQAEIARDAEGDAELAELVAAAMAEHLTDDERASVGSMASAMTLGESGRYVAGKIAEAAGADIGFIGHTSFGAGFPAGEISLYDYNSVLRFEGKIVTAEVDAAVLEEILGRVNQDGDLPLEARTGDFLYVAPEGLAQKETYILAGNDWSFINQKNYFGREDLVFTEIEGLMLKPMIIETLK
ncbi:MAG: metallophosphoesterase [Candidatus Devosia phytovorans]|uniref:Metallophosphoesterase n=1 Tax=Candidatus Devosia phytovorans TaxID=3121372 RepID=A0AAJ6B0H3_9HYPH|nr:metallophosphoesterase [Devosia sp.]WEK04254.1 MAG: metallophosphoesterase [Devosia sp.]